MGQIDILELIARLEDMVRSGTRFPFTNKVAVDEKEFLDMLDAIHLAVPTEVHEAKQIQGERERLLLEAHAEAESIVGEAKRQAAIWLDQNEVLNMARQQAETMLADAQGQAADIRDGADQYVITILGGLEGELNRLLAVVRKGRAGLENMSRQAAASPAAQATRRSPGSQFVGDGGTPPASA